jgi:hypothetical protein
MAFQVQVWPGQALSSERARGQVRYPHSISVSSLEAARRRAIEESNRDPSAKVDIERDYRKIETYKSGRRRNPSKKRNAGQSGSNNSPTRTRTATSTKATTTGNKTGTSTGGAVSGGGGNITVNVKRNPSRPPKGWMPASAVRIERLRGGAVKVHIRRRR